MLLGVALLVVDLHAPTHGVLTAGGLISLLFGLALLFQNEPGVYRVNLWLIIGIGGAIGIFWVFATGKALAARRLPVETGVQMMVGQVARYAGRGSSSSTARSGRRMPPTTPSSSPASR